MSLKHRTDGRDIIVDHQWDICIDEFAKHELSFHKAYVRNAWKLDQTVRNLSLVYTSQRLNTAYIYTEKIIEYYYSNR